jgi:hypothetical protein
LLQEFYLKFDQGQIRSDLNPSAQLLPPLFGQLARRTPFATLRPLDPTALAQRPHDLFRPAQADTETPGQFLKAPVSPLIRLHELPAQIV